jgi:hypothetical protein
MMHHSPATDGTDNDHYISSGKKVSDMKDSEEKSKLASARKNLDNYILSMFSDESFAD